MPKPLLAAFAVLLLLVGGLFGFGVGAGKAQPRWYTTPATVDAEAQTATFNGDGAAFELIGQVRWLDGQGKAHLDGWPECLTDRTTSATFLATVRPVEFGDDRIRPVLAVDCRG